MVYLSLCMIVKNEEKVLRRCLDSVKGIVDEIVIADTGSTDNTIKIASEYTDLIYNFEWTDSFSDARNFAQVKASGNWILVLDADEYVDRTNLEAVKKEIKQYDSNMDALGVTIYNFTGTGDQIVQHKCLRIYKNNKNIGYERAIHEALVSVNGHLKTVMSALNIYHTGYLTEVAKNKDKRARNTRLLEKQTQKSGNSSYDQFNLGNEFFSAKDMKKALESYQKSYAADKNSSWASFAVVQIIICLIELTRYKEAISVIDDADRIWQDVPEFKYLRGQVYYLQNRLDDSKEQLTNLLKMKNKYINFVKSSDFIELYPYMVLGLIYEKEQDLTKAVSNFAHVLSNNRNDFSATYNLLSILSKSCSTEDILKFMDVHKLSTSENYLNHIKISFILQNNELMESFINRISDEIKIKKGILLRYSLQKAEYALTTDILNSLSDNDINKILSSGEFFSCIDLFLLYLVTQDEKVFCLIEKILANEKGTIEFLRSTEIKTESDKKIFIALLDKCIKNQWFDLFEKLVLNNESSDNGLNMAIGHMLYNNRFDELALDFYDKINDVKFLEETAFINIVEILMKRNELQMALDYAICGVELKYTDYRLFKCAIEILCKINNQAHKSDVVKLAMNYYPDSNWLRQHKC